MIISASRRTDIPAFYSDWFMNRVREGWCCVPNPLNANQVSQVSLKPVDVEAIVFWSKNPLPLISHLSELDELGFRYYFQFTLNDYPGALEPGIPSINSRLLTFQKLSQHIGSARVVWRYDPIIISNITPIEYHIDRFTNIAEELRGVTQRVMVSFVDYYRKTERHLAHLEIEEGFSFDRTMSSSPAGIGLLKSLSTIAQKNNIVIFTCAEERDYTEAGISPGRCIDETILRQVWSLNLKYRKDPSQRKSCSCMASKDIGINNTCVHGCPYCYATTNSLIAQRKYTEHNPHSPLLWGGIHKIANISKKEEPQMRLL